MIHCIDLEFQGQAEVIAAYLLIEGDHIALVETGPYVCWNVLCQGLAKHGVKPEQVKDVFLSHIHFDHAGAAWAFAKLGAQIHVHPFGSRHLADPTRLWDSASRIYGAERMEQLWGKMEKIDSHKITATADWASIPFGNSKIIAHHSPGHAKHHIAWQYNEALFTGDVGGVKIQNGPVEPPCPPPDIDFEAWTQSIERLSSLTEVSRLYLTHFDAIETEIDSHWKTLKTKLTDWFEFIEKNKDLSLETLEQKFIEKISNTRGNAQKIQACYALANPAEMNLTGIRRALSKR